MMASVLIEDLKVMIEQFGDRAVIVESSGADVGNVDEGEEYTDAGTRQVFILQDDE